MAVSAGKILIMPKGAWDSTTTYRYLDMVTHNDSKWLCKVESCVGIEPSTLSTAYWFAWDDSNVGGSTVTFQTRQSRQDLTSGDTVATLFGKIKKWLIDMKDVAFTGSFGDLTDIPKATQSDLGLVKVDGTTITVTSDGVISSSASDVDAEDVTYDNEVSQLLSENVQDAIDETVTSINGITQTIGAKSGLPDPTSTVVANIATISDTIGDVADLPTPTDTVAENIYSLNDSLATNNVSFNFDYKDGQYGWNESPERGADTFHPFRSGAEEVIDSFQFISYNPETASNATDFVQYSVSGYKTITINITVKSHISTAPVDTIIGIKDGVRTTLYSTLAQGQTYTIDNSNGLYDTIEINHIKKVNTGNPRLSGTITRSN